MKKVLPVLFISLFTGLIHRFPGANAQIPLAPFIGLNALPADSTPICEIPMYPDVTPDLEGPFEGTLINDFKLYTLDGDSVQMSGLLNDRKPVLLIGCSYTCYVFRGKINKINSLKEMYGDSIKIYLVYTVEAHPVIDFSPYFGYEVVGSDNYAEGILYRQPTTYGERKAIVSDMLANEDIEVPVLIDGPCNAWWLNFGTAPNCAFLIDPDGYVYDAENWFDKAPEDIQASINSLLDTVSAGTYTPTGVFTAVDEGEDTYYGTVDNIISAHITLTNTSTDDVLIDFLRTGVDIPSGWQTSLCTELCFSPSQDSTSVYLLPGESETVLVDFITDEIPSAGNVDVVLKNRYDVTNTYSFSFHAESIASVGVENVFSASPLIIYPNPIAKNSSLSVNYIPSNNAAQWFVFDVQGNMAKTGFLNYNGRNEIDLKDIYSGIYFLRIADNGSNYIAPFEIQ